MKRYIAFGSRHPYLLAAICVVLFLPWVWMVALLPYWATLTALALVPLSALLSLALIARDFAGPEDEHQAEGMGSDQGLFKWQKRTRLFQQVVVGLDTMLGRWDTIAEQQNKTLAMLGESLEEVMKTTEEAVSEISRNFRVAVAKAKEQTDVATALLHGGDKSTSVHSLMKGYDEQLQSVTESMRAFSSAAGDIDSHQRKVAEQARTMETLIDQLRRLSSEISRISLDASVKMTNQTINPRDFVEMSDRVRNLSGDAHDLTRKMQSALDAIEQESRSVNTRTRKVADAARSSVERAKGEVAKLNKAALQHNELIAGTLKKVSDLSTEIQGVIYNIIQAMQFQDITRQKLERVHKPALGDAANRLSTLSHETKALLQRDLYRAVRQYAESAIRPRDREPRAPASQHAQQPVVVVAGSDKKVELF